MLEAYCSSMQGHIKHLESQLEQLAAIQRPFNQFESLAAERLIQVLIEACIGIAKQWVKHKGLGIAQDAKRAFMLLEQNAQWSSKDLDWRRIIGMRNALVQDYLNIDAHVILDVIHKRRYKELVKFAEHGLITLNNSNKTK